MGKRLEIAWLRRRDIFEFVQLNPGCKMSAIVGKFSRTSNETIRKAVYNLSSLGYLIATGRSPRQFIYHAADVPFYTVEDSRKRLVETALEASRTAHEKRKMVKPKIHKPIKPKQESWRIVYVSGDKRAMDGTPIHDAPIPNQGGQGALRRTVTVNCENY